MLGRWFALGGVVAALSASGLDPSAARSAASQDWSPFVLVAGLLLVGLVADEDRLFTDAGYRMSRVSSNGVVLYVGAMLLVSVVTALLNLDTSVAFLTPVLIYAARSRRQAEAPLLYGCLLVSNGASLLLPGSNLTNLIVLGHLNLSGARFFTHMAPPWVVAVAITISIVGIRERRALGTPTSDPADHEHPSFGLGLAGIVAVTVLVLALRSPAPFVAVVGVAAVAIRAFSRRTVLNEAVGVLGIPVLLGLFGTAVALGSLGRAWSGPSTLMSHVDGWGTAVIAALASVLFNNLPAASLLAARTPRHPFALLVGLNLGPNIFVTGSLAWFVWLRAARAVGASPSIRRASLLGLCAAPVSIAAAVGVLMITSLR